jgi:hypothetical protein
MAPQSPAAPAATVPPVQQPWPALPQRAVARPPLAAPDQAALAAAQPPPAPARPLRLQVQQKPKPDRFRPIYCPVRDWAVDRTGGRPHRRGRHLNRQSHRLQMKCLCAVGPSFDVPAEIIPLKSLINRFIADVVRDSCSLCRIYESFVATVMQRRVAGLHRPGANLRSHRKHRAPCFPPVSPSIDLGTSNSAARADFEIRHRQAHFSLPPRSDERILARAEKALGATPSAPAACSAAASVRGIWPTCAAPRPNTDPEAR